MGWGGGGDIGHHQRGEEAYGEYSEEDDGIAQREMCGLTSFDGRKGVFIDLFMFLFSSSVSGPYVTWVLIKVNGKRNLAYKFKSYSYTEII